MEYIRRQERLVPTLLSCARICNYSSSFSKNNRYYISKATIPFLHSDWQTCSASSQRNFTNCDNQVKLHRIVRNLLHSGSRLAISVKTRNDQQKSDIRRMSDEQYIEFLNKTNESDAEGGSKTKLELNSSDQSVEIPEALLKATQGTYYVSDADEPFVPVVLKVDDGLPDEVSFAKLVIHPEPNRAEVRIMNTSQWDPHDQYSDIVNNVKQVVQNNQVRVYQVGISDTMSEYWIVGVKDEFLLGVKALAIES